MGTAITTHVTRRTLLVLFTVLLVLTIVLSTLALPETLEATGKALLASTDKVPMAMTYLLQ